MKLLSLAQRVSERTQRVALLASKKTVQTVLYPFSRQGSSTTVFVAGNQRSGTNMLMEVLEKSYHTEVFHERDPRAFVNYQMRERRIVKELVEQSKAPCVVIKALCESQEIAQLLNEFSPASAIWVFRDYNDVVNSMLNQFRGMADQARRVAKHHDSCGWRGRGMSDETHALVRRLVRPNINDASASALQWYYRNVLFFEQGLDSDPRVILVRYEDMVTQPEEQFARIFSFLDIPFSPRVCRDIFLTSVRKREPPVIDPEIRAACDQLLERLSGATG